MAHLKAAHDILRLVVRWILVALRMLDDFTQITVERSEEQWCSLLNDKVFWQPWRLMYLLARYMFRCRRTTWRSATLGKVKRMVHANEPRAGKGERVGLDQWIEVVRAESWAIHMVHGRTKVHVDVRWRVEDVVGRVNQEDDGKSSRLLRSRKANYMIWRRQGFKGSTGWTSKPPRRQFFRFWPQN